MTIIQKIRAELVICKVAHEHGITPAECKAGMAAAIADAWATSDPEAKRFQIELVGDSHIPSPQEFLILAASRL